MSCYFGHMKDVFEEAGVEITKENKKEIDRIIHTPLFLYDDGISRAFSRGLSYDILQVFRDFVNENV